MKIYFTLITTICSLLPFCFGRLFSTFYLSYSSRQMVDSRIYVSKRNLLKDVMRSDDSPYQLVQLPFPFIYFGQSLNMLFVSPNGGKVTHLYITSTRVFINDLTHIQHCILLRISLALLMRSVVNSKETSEVLFVDY
jgi:hypothetical protein